VFRTLIVEDNYFNRKTLKDLFTGHFSSVIVEEASNGKEAAQIIEPFRPDLVIMDIRLPDVSGLELTKKIKEVNPNVKVLILTGHHYPEYKEAAARYGADGFLVKGGESKEILAMVESFFPKAEEVTTAENK
jgi:two-component system, response regulator YesN